MGLKLASIKKAVSAAFTAVGEVVSTATYRRTVSVYTPSTGGMVKTNTDYTIPLILVGFSSFEVDRVSVLTSDQKAILQTKELSVVPSPATDTVLKDGKVYSIIRYTTDPAGATYTLHLRAP